MYSEKVALGVCDISKIVKGEALDMPSPHKHPFNNNLQIPFASNPETDWKMAVSRTNKTLTENGRKTWDSPLIGVLVPSIAVWLGRKSLAPTFSQGKEGPVLYIQHPNFSEAATQKTSFCVTSYVIWWVWHSLVTWEKMEMAAWSGRCDSFFPVQHKMIRIWKNASSQLYIMGWWGVHVSSALNFLRMTKELTSVSLTNLGGLMCLVKSSC